MHSIMSDKEKKIEQNKKILELQKKFEALLGEYEKISGHKLNLPTLPPVKVDEDQ